MTKFTSYYTKRCLVKQLRMEQSDIELGRAAISLCAPFSLDAEKQEAYQQYQDFKQSVQLAYQSFPANEDGPAPQRELAFFQEVFTRIFPLKAEDAATPLPPENCNLVHVLQTGQAAPSLLGLIWTDLFETVGLSVEPIKFPRSGIIRLTQNGQKFLLDPTAPNPLILPKDLRQHIKNLHGNDAELISRDYTVLNHSNLVVRLLKEQARRFKAAGQYRKALRHTKLLTRINPDAWQWLRDAGVLCLLLGRGAEAKSYFDSAFEKASTLGQRELYGWLHQLG